MVEAHSELSELATIKRRAFKWLDRNPLLTAKPLCKLLELPWPQYQSYMDNVRAEWKSSLKLRLGSKPHSFHHARGWVYVDKLRLSRSIARVQGWVLSRNRNRALLWKDEFGRMEWFETGRVNLYVKPPPLKGRLWQLFCNGFSHTGLVDSMLVLGELLKSIRFKGATAVWETGIKLPYVVIDLFKRSNGIRIKLGDTSHPSGVEVEFCYPDFAEKNERLLRELLRLLQPASGSPEKPSGPGASYVA